MEAEAVSLMDEEAVCIHQDGVPFSGEHSLPLKRVGSVLRSLAFFHDRLQDIIGLEWLLFSVCSLFCWSPYGRWGCYTLIVLCVVYLARYEVETLDQMLSMLGDNFDFQGAHDSLLGNPYRVCSMTMHFPMLFFGWPVKQKAIEVFQSIPPFLEGTLEAMALPGMYRAWWSSSIARQRWTTSWRSLGCLSIIGHCSLPMWLTLLLFLSMICFTGLSMTNLAFIRARLAWLREMEEKELRTQQDEEDLVDHCHYLVGFWKPAGSAAWLSNLRLMGRVCDEVRENLQKDAPYRAGKDHLGSSRLLYRNMFSALRGWLKISSLSCFFAELSTNERASISVSIIFTLISLCQTIPPQIRDTLGIRAKTCRERYQMTLWYQVWLGFCDPDDNAAHPVVVLIFNLLMLLVLLVRFGGVSLCPSHDFSFLDAALDWNDGCKQ